MTRTVNSAEPSTSNSSRQKANVFVIMLFPIAFLQVAYGQDNIRPFQMIRGRLVNSRTGSPVVFAQVINKELRSGVLSDSVGFFSLTARMNDTLYIKSINFNPITIPVSDSLLWQFRVAVIPLTEQVYELGTVDIYGWGNYQEFKYKILHTPAPEDKSKKLQDELVRAIRKGPRNGGQVQMGIPLGSPITALYNVFSKEGKFHRRYERVKERDRVFLLTFQKFNRDIVAQITGLTGSLLDEFMLFCKPDDEFLLVASDYDLYHRILDDYEHFKKMKLETKNKASL